MVTAAVKKLVGAKAPWDVPERRAFGACLREARETRRLSQEQLSTELGIAAPYVSQIESGRKIPSDELCTKMARVLPNALDWDALRVEAQKLRTPEVLALFERPDHTPALSNNALFQKLRAELADDRLPVQRREHLIKLWLRDIAVVRDRMDTRAGRRARGKPQVRGRTASAANGKGSR